MRKIERSTAFRRDYKRESKGKYRKELDDMLLAVFQVLANDNDLEISYRDHALSGDWSGCRECHTKPDLLLIVKKMIACSLSVLALTANYLVKNLFWDTL